MPAQPLPPRARARRPGDDAPSQRILVIKLGALGDFVHAFHAFAAIRAHHPASHIALLTTSPFQGLAAAAPWFDEVIIDRRAPWWNVAAAWRTARAIATFGFVYDLQTSGRSGRYFWLAGRPAWSGITATCSHPHRNPRRDTMHTLERQREQLLSAGISHVPPPDRAWLARSGSRHGMAAPYVLLVPGSGGQGEAKRWPVARFAAVAQHLAAIGLQPVVIGGRGERALGRAITIACPSARDLTDQTSFADIAALGAGSALVLGNDTGPLQLACSMGAPTITLFSAASVPEQVAPRGPAGEWAATMRARVLDDLPVEQVIAAVDQRLGAGPSQRSQMLSSSPLP